MSGRMNELHALHWQRMAKRDIVITENPGLHLLWYDSTIFVKPVSPFLLDHNFFLEHICPDDTLFRAACGFLRSYAHLIQHESDFRIAHSLGLLPTHVTWMQWSEFAYSLSNIPLSDVNERYQYGELQLNRINLIYNVFRARPWYYKIHRDYQSWLSYELGFMFVLLAYVSVVMSGFQVVLTTPLVSWDISVLCYWTSMAAIVLTVAVIAWHCLGFILCSFLSFMQALR
ncbi:hypothetical protein ID866_5266 [Astraeus odoratus]|nr:hypothetical protein ID866_5266 [Astraeus odoratus]